MIILLADDSRADVRLTELALDRMKGQLGFSYRLLVVRDGVEAVRFLRREGEHRDAPRPNLIILDLNMPRMDGREVLIEIKRDPEIKNIPVIIFSTSDAFSDIEFAYSEHANSYITKPLDLQEYLAAFQNLAGFWIQTAELPGDRSR